MPEVNRIGKLPITTSIQHELAEVSGRQRGLTWPEAHNRAVRCLKFGELVHSNTGTTSPHTDVIGTGRKQADLPEVDTNDIVISRPGLQKAFLGDLGDLVGTIRSFFEIFRAEETRKTRITHRIKDTAGRIHHIELSLKYSGGHHVWTFQKSHIDVVAEACSLTPKTALIKLGESEISTASKSLIKVFRGHLSTIREALERLNLPDPGTTQVNVYKYTPRDEAYTIAFHRRQSGSNWVWAIAQSDVQILGRVLSLTPRDSTIAMVSDSEVCISLEGIKNIFRSDHNKIVDVLTKTFDLPALREDGPSTLTRTIPSSSIVVKFNLRRNERSLVWALSQIDACKVAKAFGFAMRNVSVENISDDEISITPRSLAKIFQGNGSALQERVCTAFSLPDPQLSSQPEYTYRPVSSTGVEGPLIFSLRQSRKWLIWTLPKQEIHKVGKICGLRLKDTALKEISDTEIAVSANSLMNAFRGVPSELFEKVTALLHLPDRNSGKTEVTYDLSDGTGAVAVNLSLRRSGVNVVWAFDAKYLSFIGRICGFVSRDEANDEDFDRLDLWEAVALLASDPLRFQQFLRICYPELTPASITKLARGAFRGLGGTNIEEPQRQFQIGLQEPELTSPEQFETNDYSFTLKGKVHDGTKKVQIEGAYTRTIIVRHDGSFEARLPLVNVGQEHIFFVYTFDLERKLRSASIEVLINQTSPKPDLDSAFLQLLELRRDVAEQCKADPKRWAILQRAVEMSLLKRFTSDEQAAFKELDKQIKGEASDAKARLLRRVREKFHAVAKVSAELTPSESLFFFQKYCIFEIREARQSGKRGILLALEQGLGKTLVSLALTQDDALTTIAPNAVVTSWAEMERKFFGVSTIKVIEGKYSLRDKILATTQPKRMVTNVEFLRKVTLRRAELLTSRHHVLILDEADYLGSKTSQQSIGTRKLPAAFRLLLSGTPFTRISQISHLLSFMNQEDPRFSSARAFAKAFPEGERDALDALHALMQEHMIRIRKGDVFDTYDPTKPLHTQGNRLPSKQYQPPVHFELSVEQCLSIRELLTDYQKWCRKHKGHESFEDRAFSRYSEGYFSKREAIRQIMNNPRYIGFISSSPKHNKMNEIVTSEIARESKILIFCRYRAEIEEYAKRYTQFGAITYYGGTSGDNQGYKVDEFDQTQYFEVDKDGSFIFDDRGNFKSCGSEGGRPIRALDYQRLRFQNSIDCRIMIASYDSGAVGVTLTAADAVIFSDLPASYRDEYQAGDRVHRIDTVRKKYEIRFYHLLASYPKEFLDALPRQVRERYFSEGTFDELQNQALRRQQGIFHQIMDGIGSEDELEKSEGAMKTRIATLLGLDTEEPQDPSSISEFASVVDKEGDPSEVGAKYGGDLQLLDKLLTLGKAYYRLRFGDIAMREASQADLIDYLMLSMSQHGNEDPFESLSGRRVEHIVKSLPIELQPPTQPDVMLVTLPSSRHGRKLYDTVVAPAAGITGINYRSRDGRWKVIIARP